MNDFPFPHSDRSSGRPGHKLAAPAWADFYNTGWQERPGADWLPPNGMISAIIDPESGELATEYCPRRVREWFKPGTEPTEICDEHYELPEAEPFVVGLGSKLGEALKKIFKF